MQLVNQDVNKGTVTTFIDPVISKLAMGVNNKWLEYRSNTLVNFEANFRREEDTSHPFLYSRWVGDDSTLQVLQGNAKVISETKYHNSNQDMDYWYCNEDIIITIKQELFSNNLDRIQLFLNQLVSYDSVENVYYTISGTHLIISIEFSYCDNVETGDMKFVKPELVCRTKSKESLYIQKLADECQLTISLYQELAGYSYQNVPYLNVCEEVNMVNDGFSTIDQVSLILNDSTNFEKLMSIANNHPSFEFGNNNLLFNNAISLNDGLKVMVFHFIEPFYLYGYYQYNLLCEKLVQYFVNLIQPNQIQYVLKVKNHAN